MYNIMTQNTIHPDFVCPNCKGDLIPVYDTEAKCSHGCKVSVNEGIVNFMADKELSAEEIKSNTEYAELAASYDNLMSWYFEIFGEDESAARKFMTDQLEVKSGDKVLEVGCGTGSDSVFINKKIGKSGKLFLLEISESMIRLAKNKLSQNKEDNQNIFYGLADVTKLPFKDNYFDSAFHFGGLNNFPDMKGAIQELNRVVKPGGKVVIGDEGIPVWLRNETHGQTIMEYNSQYKHEIPLHILDPKSRNVTVRWLIGNAFYLIDYVVSKEPLVLKTDIKNPFFNKSVAEWVKEKREMKK